MPPNSGSVRASFDIVTMASSVCDHVVRNSDIRAGFHSRHASRMIFDDLYVEAILHPETLETFG